MSRSQVLAILSAIMVASGFQVFSQATPPVTQSAKNSLCSNIVTLTGDTKLNCSGLTPAQQKLLEGIPPLLKKLLASQSDSQAVLAKVKDCLGDMQNIKDAQTQQLERLNEIEAAVEELGLTPTKLLSIFPVGYVIFDVNYRNDVFPYQSKKLLDKYELDWSQVRIEECPQCGPDNISIHMPDIALKGGGKVFVDWHGVFPKNKPSSQRMLMVNDLEIDGAILAFRPQGIVFLIGFNGIR